MSDQENEYLDPQVPEYEHAYPPGGPDAFSYGTGSTTPPRDYAGLVAMVLVLLISFSSLLSALSLMNIHVFQETQASEPGTALSFSSREGTLPAGLENRTGAATLPTEQISVQHPTADADPHMEIMDSPAAEENYAQEGALSWQEVYEKVIPSVVSIICTASDSTVSGTGVIMDANGYLITNAHVVENAVQIRVLLSDDREFTAQVVGADAISDLAVLKIEATGLTAAEFGDSSALRVGDEVVAIGDPLGVELRGTMTDGIISAINRDIKTGGKTMTLLQTTAALNSGNSGGPLVNCYGQVVGINTMKIGDYASTYGVEGLGFAIPTSTVSGVVEQLLTNGYVAGRPSLGISGGMVSLFYQHYYRLPAGLLIDEVAQDSDAAAQGIRKGDILLSLDDVRIKDTATLEEFLYSCEVGQQVTAGIYRNGREYNVSLTIGEARG